MTLDEAYAMFARRTPEQRERGPLATPVITEGDADLWPAIATAFALFESGMVAVAESDRDLDVIVRAARRNLPHDVSCEVASLMLGLMARKLYAMYDGRSPACAGAGRDD